MLGRVCQEVDGFGIWELSHLLEKCCFLQACPKNTGIQEWFKESTYYLSLFTEVIFVLGCFIWFLFFFFVLANISFAFIEIEERKK